MKENGPISLPPLSLSLSIFFNFFSPSIFLPCKNETIHHSIEVRVILRTWIALFVVSYEPFFAHPQEQNNPTRKEEKKSMGGGRKKKIRQRNIF